MLSSIKNYTRIKLSPEVFAILLGLYFSIILNHTFCLNLYKIHHILGDKSWVVLLSLGFIAILFQIILLNIFLWSKTAKYLGIVLLVVTITANYFCKNYGINFDRNMLINIFSTNFNETSELLTINLFLEQIRLGLIPILIIIFGIKINQIKLKVEFLRKLILILGTTAIIICVVIVNFRRITYLIKYYPNLKYQLLPTSFMVAGIRNMLEKSYLKPHNNSKPIDLDPEAIKLSADPTNPPLTVVIVLGETVRAHNWGLSGYTRQTTPKLSRLNLINFPYINSCGTTTEVSLPCMFSPLGRKDYNKRKQPGSIFHLLNNLGIDVIWIDNQSGSKGVATGLNEIKAERFDLAGKYCTNRSDCLDEVLINGLIQNISSTEKDQIIVLHQLGNHGPAYFQRYPQEFNHFSPTCNSYDLIKCSTAEIINTYDNAILYTDYILAKIIKLIDAIKSRKFLLIYVSDHGESLGEYNIYLHGMPYKIAPEYQKKVPLALWYSKNLPLNFACLDHKSAYPADHDNLYHTLLGIFKIKSKTYDKTYDLFYGCYNK